MNSLVGFEQKKVPPSRNLLAILVKAWIHSNKIPPWKLTWHWKIPMFNRKYIFKWWNFHCHVSFRGGSPFLTKNYVSNPQSLNLNKKNYSATQSQHLLHVLVPKNTLQKKKRRAGTYSHHLFRKEHDLNQTSRILCSSRSSSGFFQPNRSIYPYLSSQGPLLWPPERKLNNNHFHIRYPYCLTWAPKNQLFSKMEVK